ncbi:MAG: type IV pilus modification protein PilV [Arenimonas sp.]
MKRNSRGFSMIEVMISVVVLGFGLMALAALQTSLIRSSAETKAQTVALQLAKDKLEDLRSFQTLTGYQAVTTGTDTVNDSNGNLGGVNYSRAWTVTRFGYQPSTGAFAAIATLTGPTPAANAAGVAFTSNNEYKRVAITVSWTDANGSTQSIGLDDAIGAVSPGDGSKVVLNNTASSEPRYPRVLINDPSLTEGVIPIAVGDGTETAATNPKPEIVGNGNNQHVAETRFDVLTYAALNDNTAQVQSRVETVVIGCACNNTASTGTAYRPSYWNGFRYTVPVPASYAPPARVATLANNAPPQSQYCTTCCRDHHDPATATGAKFDPRRSTHSHYKIVAGALTLAGAGEDYLESCRLIRVDGIFRVAADFNNDYFNLLATRNDGTSGAYAPTQTATTNYQNIVLDYLDQRVVSQGNSANYNTLLSSTAVAGLEDARDINDPDSISLLRSNDFKWLHSRGLFIDYLEPEAIDKITNAKSACTSPTPMSSCVLKYVPFTSINLTELTNWTPTSGPQIVVTNADFSGSTGGVPVRGKVTPGSSPTNNSTQTAYASIFNSNSGLALLPKAIDPDEASMTDAQNFNISIGVPPIGGGTYNVNVQNYNFALSATYPNLSALNTVCNFATANPPNPYSCTTSLLGLGTLNISSYNYEGPKVAVSATAGSSGISCSSTNGANITTITNVGFSIPASSNNAKRVCRNFRVDSVSPGVIGAVSNEGKGSESTALLVTTTSGGTINIGMAADAADTESTLLSCKYSGNYSNNATIPDNKITLTWSNPCQ